jgi:hypothetical protein
MQELKTNTAIRIPVGPFVDQADGKTAEVALDVTEITVEIFRKVNDGGAVTRTAFAPTAAAGDNDMVHIADDVSGMYDLELTAAQLNWLGTGRINFFDASEILVHWEDISVISANYFDYKYGTGNVNAETKVITAGVITADAIAANAITDAKINTGAITSAKFAASAINADAIATDAITAVKIAANAITDAKINTGAITSAKFAAGAINADAIAANAITAVKIADSALTSAKVATTLPVDVVAVSGDAIAADNLEADYDGTGYTKANSTIGTCTANTDMRGTNNALLAASAPTNFGDLAITVTTGRVSADADVVSISGDTTAADNLELDYDGTGYTKANSTIGTTTTNTDMRGTDDALLAASAPTNFGDLSIEVTTGIVEAKAVEIAADAVDAASVKADAVTKIQAGLATPTNITAATGVVLADGSLTATKVTGELPINIKRINDVEIEGVGTALDKWRAV